MEKSFAHPEDGPFLFLFGMVISFNEIVSYPNNVTKFITGLIGSPLELCIMAGDNEIGGLTSLKSPALSSVFTIKVCSLFPYSSPDKIWISFG